MDDKQTNEKLQWTEKMNETCIMRRGWEGKASSQRGTSHCTTILKGYMKTNMPGPAERPWPRRACKKLAFTTWSRHGASWHNIKKNRHAAKTPTEVGLRRNHADRERKRWWKTRNWNKSCNDGPAVDYFDPCLTKHVLRISIDCLMELSTHCLRWASPRCGFSLQALHGLVW